MTVTEQPLPQHEWALSKANDTRLWRAGMKRRLAACETTVVAVLIENDPRLAKMTIGDLLSAQWRWKGARTARFLRNVDKLAVSEWRQVGDITERQKALLIAALQEV